jgi:putative ABC transport system permease protein
MKRKLSLLPGMAVNNIRKNGSTYFPYIGVSIFALFTYFVFDLIQRNDVMMTVPKGAYAAALVMIGFVLLGLIMVPFLYYTNSFLIKRRKKELGLYSILGLEKKHIGVMMFWESLIIYGVVTVSAIILGLLFSRLVFLLLLNLAKMQVDVEFTISPVAIIDTLIFYAFITGLNLFVNLVQVGKANPVELMSDARRGEKEPRFVALWSIAGVLALGIGYRMAVLSRLDNMIFTNFFLAVFLVIIGTYFLFTSGSISFLRILKGRKKFYYRPENFITISGMLYRMKKSAASLSNICVFSTMVMITVACTVSVYLGMDSIVSYRISRDVEVFYSYSENPDLEQIRQQAALLAEKNNVLLKDELVFPYAEVKTCQEGNRMRDRRQDDNYMNWTIVKLMTVDAYNEMEGASVSLEEGQALIFSTGADFLADRILMGDEEFVIKEELQSNSFCEKKVNDTFNKEYLLVVRDMDAVTRAGASFGVDGIRDTTCRYGFNPSGEKENIDSFSQELNQYASEVTGFMGFSDHRERMSEQESMYGGLLFIGIFFGSIFLICLLIIMYYKQITEGFEDQKNFEIMQKVGMSDGEIRRTIRKQVSMVFALPLVGALLHTVMGMKMVCMLLGAINFFETNLLIIVSAAVCLVFACVYVLCYSRTSRTYYRIVKQM